MYYYKQNFEDQYFDKFGFPMMTCNSHQNDVYQFINLNNKNHNKLACAQCIIKNRLNTQFLISIKDIYSKDPNNIIQNWPPLQDLSIYQQLISHSLQECKKPQTIQQINQFFDKFKQDVLKTIEEHQKNILMHINSIEENRQGVINVYNEISNKDEIKNEFLKNKNNSLLIEQYLNETILTKQTQSKVNQQNIQNAINIFTKSSQQFQLEYIQNTFKQILISLKSIDLLNPLLITDQLQSLKISDKKEDQDEEIVQNLKMISKKEENQNKNVLNEIDLLQSLKIIKSNYGYPDKISLRKIENNYLLIEKRGQQWSQVIIDEELIGEKKYQILIDLKQNNQNYSTVGLLPISQKDKAGENSKLSLNLWYSGYGIDKIDSGKHISELRKDEIKQISIQICLKEKILRCLCVDNTNVKNINSLDDWNKINPNQKYYFYIALNEGSNKIKIKQFKIIKQFDEW